MTIHKKLSLPLKISLVNDKNPQETADLVTFIEEILNGKLRFFWCSMIRWTLQLKILHYCTKFLKAKEVLSFLLFHSVLMSLAFPLIITGASKLT